MADDRPPCEDRQQQGYRCGEDRFPKIAGEIIDAERPAGRIPVTVGDQE
jgi:hypothetical protein